MKFSLTRRRWLIGSAAALGACATGPDQVAGRVKESDMPVEEVGRRVLAAVRAHEEDLGAWGAAVACSRRGERFAAATGWCDADRTRPVQNDTLFRIASVTKPITVAIVRTLVREKKLALADRAFTLLDLEPVPDKGDPRLKDITVEHLLRHEGGWDRTASYDPMFHQAKIKQELGLCGPVGIHDIVRYMLGQPLQFVPGEKKAYSNFGYCLLGRIIERVTETLFPEALKSIIAAPLGIEADLQLGRQRDRSPRETEYGGDQQSFDLDVMDAHGGLIATPSALCRLLEAYWISGEPRGADASQDWTCFGSLPGTSAMTRQRPDGWNVAVLLNGRRDENYQTDLDSLKKRVDEALG
jgi:CubicO group peptidase (beta-lactamase class C family)